MSELSDMKKGFTMIEIIISLALVSILTLMLGSIFSYSLNRYIRGSSLHEEQFNIRFVLNQMENEIRNAEMVDFISTTPTDSVNNYVYFDGSVIRVGKRTFSVDAGKVNDVRFNLTQDNGRLLLTIETFGIDGFDLTTEVFLNNITASKYKFHVNNDGIGDDDGNGSDGDNDLSQSDVVNIVGESSIQFERP